MRNRLKDALNSLPPTSDKKVFVDICVDELAILFGNILDKRPAKHAFNKIGLKATLGELRALGRVVAEAGSLTADEYAGRLQASISNLHQPAVLALADVGVMRQAMPDAPPALLMDKVRSAMEIATLRHDRIPSNAGRGRPDSRVPSALGLVLYRQVLLLTGKAPKQGNSWINEALESSSRREISGPFISLVTAVLGAVGMDDPPVAVAEAAIRTMRDRNKLSD